MGVTVLSGVEQAKSRQAAAMVTMKRFMIFFLS
jgi:hypothetical protein